MQNTKIEWVASIPYVTKHGIVHHKSIPVDWRGIQVRTQSEADERIPLLLQTPATVRFLSCEPLLSEIKFTRAHQYCPEHDFHSGCCTSRCKSLRSIDWVIVGGESGGPNVRPCNLTWIRSIVQQCKAAGVPVFVKQLGGNLSDADAGECARSSGRSMHDPKGGNPTEWPEDLRVREYPR